MTLIDRGKGNKMVVTSLSRKEAGEIYNEIRDVHETDFYWYVEALVEIFENHGWQKQQRTIHNPTTGSDYPVL